MADVTPPAVVDAEVDAGAAAGGDAKEIVLDEAGQPIIKSELKRRAKVAQKEAEKAEKVAKAAAAAAAAPEKKPKAGGAVVEEELDPSRCVKEGARGRCGAVRGAIPRSLTDVSGALP